MSTKTILTIAGGILALTLLIFSVACQDEIRASILVPNKTIRVENENSPLLKMLPMPDDFSKDFTWSDLLIMQSSSDAGENATSMLDGFCRGFKFSMFNQIKQFANIADVRESAVEADFAVQRGGELSRLHLMKIVETQKFTCYYWINDFTECDIVIVYDDKVIGLQVMLEAGADKLILEQITNSLLLAIQEDLE